MKTVQLFVLLLFCQLSSFAQSNAMDNQTVYAFRLKPGDDLRRSIESFVKENHISAGWINTCVGSLTDYKLRLANQPEASSGSGHFEIVSLTGTLSVNGCHLHISISDSTGKTIGGHVLDGCKVYTTAEIVIGATTKYEFRREKDGTTPYEELQIRRKSE